MKRLGFVFIAALTAFILTGCPGIGPEQYMKRHYKVILKGVLA